MFSRFVSSHNAQAAEKTTQSKTHLFDSSLLRDERFIDVCLSGNTVGSLLSSAHGETKKVICLEYFIPLKLPVNLTFTFLLNEALQFSLKILRSIISLGFSSWHYRIINNLDYVRTFKAKCCEVLFSLNSSGLMSLFEVNNSHQSFPSAPLEAARFREKHDGLLRHSKVQSKVSYTVNVPIPGAFKKWYSSFTKTSWRRFGWCVKCDSILIKNRMWFHETDQNSRQKSSNFK